MLEDYYYFLYNTELLIVVSFSFCMPESILPLIFKNVSLVYLIWKSERQTGVFHLQV